VRRNLILFALACSLLVLTLSCDTVTAAIPVTGQCHSRIDGSVLKSVEDQNGKRWPVVKYPTLEVLGTTLDDACGVRLEAGQAIYRDESHPIEWPKWWLHPETGEPIELGVFGSHRGYLSIDTQEFEWY